MSTTPILRKNTVHSLLWASLLLVSAALTARADDEYYGGGGYSGGGDVYVLPPYVVNGNDSSTFDWAGYWANQQSIELAIEAFTAPVIPPTISDYNYDNGGSGTGGYSAGSSSEWSRRGSSAPTVTPDSKTSVPALNAFLQACKTNNSLIAAMKEVKSTTNYTTKIWEQGLVVLIKPDGTVATQKVDGKGPNNEISRQQVADAFTALGASSGDVKVFYHDHANQGSLSDPDISSAVAQNTIAIARDGNNLQMAVPTGGSEAALVVGNTSTFGI